MELSKSSDKYSAAILTFLVHALIILMFFLIKFITPIPPYPEEGGGGYGFELNFGDTDEGMGNINPDLKSANNPAQAAKQLDDPEKIFTDNSQDNEINEVRKVETVKKPKEPFKPKENPKEVAKKQPEENTKALYPGNKQKGGSEGTGKKQGNQGQEGGDPYGPVYSGKTGSGGGEGTGTGGGSGGGDGTGIGTGKGPGISYDLGGRTATNLPKPAYTSERSGRVVVDITVDQDGNVLKVKAGARGTTVQDEELFRRAEEAARKAKFKANPSGPEKQIGSITYNFVRN